MSLRQVERASVRARVRERACVIYSIAPHLPWGGAEDGGGPLLIKLPSQGLWFILLQKYFKRLLYLKYTPLITFDMLRNQFLINQILMPPLTRNCPLKSLFF